MATEIDLDAALEIAKQAIAAATAAALRHFRTALEVETKADESPVTVADREAEESMIAILAAAYPDFDILGEETGEHRRGSPHRWILDPIDGTRGFARGSRLWGPLLALESEGEIVVGACALPALGETYWAAKGSGAWRDGERLEVSSVDTWKDATVSLGELGRLLDEPSGAAVSRLIERSASTRCYGDLASFLMLLNGRADVWVECGVRVWDLAPAKILIEEAGGRFTDFTGAATVESGSALGSNGRLHDEALAILR